MEETYVDQEKSKTQTKHHFVCVGMEFLSDQQSALPAPAGDAKKHILKRGRQHSSSEKQFTALNSKK